jgi:hypothetical protein
MTQPKNEIHTFFQCAACIREKPPSQSPKNFMRLNVGLTRDGLQAWCVRHDINVVRLDPDGLRDMVSLGPACACCPGGMHRS